uniref:5-methylthioadenosine/S-adenosylhomocysteine deaminase n=1 Tax=Candidatus Kentrum sp. MB TaxID=2138164 RepID=A0A451BDN9_9GAMM|nr:MAG: 5-methylthioadenosine/S-adenosylhomocysteine deaminase [Candidatus Kentron sp. MB]VFK33990.1 MAG: 5-methylthioadenosine/S-adenosylhomocysteine deaminase [Candidatus Kentron sp. MB]VFK76403.1 MAG: 5-methylthioadenosine/S-adenosylhomocysteine deaminase [Candidatus Kentron sp. MB]
MQPIDNLIHGGWIVPVEPEGVVLENHAIAIRDGIIVSVLPYREAEQRYQPKELDSFPHHVLIPGLVNAHTHAAMTLFRGIASDLPLMPWLHDHIWPAETRWVSKGFVHDGTALAAAEMLRGGVTCFNDMYFFPDEAARAVVSAGIRAVLGLIVLDFPTVWARNGEEYIARARDMHDQLRQEPLLRTALAPHAPYSVSNGSLEQVGILADEFDVPIHMHVHETEDEIDHSLEQHKERPMNRMARLGLLSPRLLAVHMTHVDRNDLTAFAASGASVAHCPESNLKLASGVCPVERLVEAGVMVAMGTDGCASNDDLDMLGEMRTATLLAKGAANSARALPVAQVLTMATLHGARALGLGDVIGSLVAGKAADIVAIDLRAIETQPVYNPLSQLVYSTNRQQVTDVWVAGQQVLRERVLITLDEDELIDKAKVWGTKIAGSM